MTIQTYNNEQVWRRGSSVANEFRWVGSHVMTLRSRFVFIAVHSLFSALAAQVTHQDDNKGLGEDWLLGERGVGCACVAPLVGYLATRERVERKACICFSIPPFSIFAIFSEHWRKGAARQWRGAPADRHCGYCWQFLATATSHLKGGAIAWPLKAPLQQQPCSLREPSEPRDSSLQKFRRRLRWFLFWATAPRC